MVEMDDVMLFVLVSLLAVTARLSAVLFGLLLDSCPCAPRRVVVFAE